MQIQPYLNFSGNCREAFEFYAKVLNGKIQMMLAYSEIPAEAEMPSCGPGWENKVMHTSMAVGDAVLMGADAPPDHYKKPVGFSVNLQINDLAEAERVYNSLSENSPQIMMPLAQTFWATRFAMFYDRFDIPWMINCNPEA
ncbi:MAG TPA: VOC family protein [Edaphobacter sp.]